MSEQQGVVGRLNAYKVDPKEVHVREGWNPRFDFGEQDDLVASVKELDNTGKPYGVRVPIRVRRDSEGRLELIDGERRLRAALAAGLEFVPAIMDPKLDDTEALVLAITANNGKPFLPLEEAAALKRLKAAGMSYLDIAKKVGRSEIHVVDRLKLLEAPDSVKDKINKGELGTTLAAEIVKSTKDPEKQEALANEAVKGPMQRRQVRTEILKTKAGGGGGDLKKRAAAQVPKFIREMAASELGNLEEEYIDKATWLVEQVDKLVSNPEEISTTAFMYQLYDLLAQGEVDVVTKKTKTKTISHPAKLDLFEIMEATDDEFYTPAARMHEVIRLALLVGKMVGMRSIVGDE